MAAGFLLGGARSLKPEEFAAVARSLKPVAAAGAWVPPAGPTGTSLCPGVGPPFVKTGASRAEPRRHGRRTGRLARTPSTNRPNLVVFQSGLPALVVSQGRSLPTLFVGGHPDTIQSQC